MSKVSGVAGYENKCKTLRQDDDSTLWSSALTRIGNEWKKLSKELPSLNEEGIFIEAEEDLSSFHIMILKKDEGPYKNIPFCFTISPCRNPESNLLYPMIPPIVKYHSLTSNWIHPNIKPSGDICISILGYSYVGGKSDVWNPAMNIRSIVLTLSGILNKNAIKNEPAYSTREDNSSDVILYDKAVEYACMKSTIEAYDDIFNPESDSASLTSSILSKTFRKQIQNRLKDSLIHFRELCNQGNRHYRVYSFSIDAYYKSLSVKIDKLLQVLF